MILFKQRSILVSARTTLVLLIASVYGQVFASEPSTSSVFGEATSFTQPGWSIDGAVESASHETASFGCVADHCVPDCDGLLNCAAGSPTWAVVAPYVWAPAMKGTIGANGNLQSVDLTLSELFDLIPDLNGAAMAHVEVGKGPRGLILDGLIMDVAPTERGPLGGRIDAETELTILEALGMQRILGTDPGSRSPSPLSVDVLAGARYYQVNGGLTINPAIGPTFSTEQSENWVDLLIGVRGKMTITDGLDAFVRGDVGGFGIGTSSELAWNLVAGVDYALDCCPGSSLLLGYKILDIDQSKNSGAERFVFDVKMQGPFVALAFRF